MNPVLVRELYFDMPPARAHRLFVRRHKTKRRRAVGRDEIAVARWSFTMIWRALRSREVCCDG